MRGLWALLLCVPLFAAAQVAPQRDKSYVDTEIRRYQSLMARGADAASVDSRYDVVYYGIDIAITTAPAYLRGTVLMRAAAAGEGLTSLTVDLMSSLLVDSVFVNDTAASVVRSATTYEVVPVRALAPGESFEVKTFYQGVPGSSGFGSFVFSSHSSTPWVWTLSEPYGAKDWWPCKDHPIDKADSVDITVRCASTLKVASNGLLAGVTEHGDGTHSYAWRERYPISTYLVFAAITNFSEFTNWFYYGGGDSMPVLNYVLPEHLSSALVNLPRTVDMLGIFSDLFGLYPFVAEKYGHNEFGWGGAMEHQTMTSTTTFSEYVIAHELAHQWFGDLITCRTWPDLWLNEGFASYCEALYGERAYGSAAYWSLVGSDLASAKTASGTLYVQDTSSVGNLFSGSRVYSKGSAVLHMLRHVVGDTDFFASMKNYAGTPSLRYGTASTEDFQQVVESTSGKDLDYFFNEWVFGERYPKYSFGWGSSPDGGGYRLQINLAQSTGTANPLFFTMPIDFRISNGGWDTTVVLFNDSLSQSFEVMVSHEPTAVELDPDNWIMKDILQSFTFSRSSLLFSNPPVFYGSERTDSLLAVNNGVGPVTIFSAVSTNPEFTVTPAAAVVNPQAPVAFYVTFRPAVVGQRSALILFTHSGPTSPDTVSCVGFGAVQSYSYPVLAGWNMLSLPLQVPDPRASVVFPGSATAAYMYDTSTQSYFVVDSLRPGIGYWLRYGSAQSILVGGLKVLSDTVPLGAGWNLIGAPSAPVAVSAVQADPPGILQTPFYAYKGSYCLTDSLRPASGYWVKTSAGGSLILSAAPAAATAGPSTDEDFLARCGIVRFRDGSGDIRRLYVAAPGGHETDLTRYVLPPLPPGGGFDVRFAPSALAGDAGRGELPLQITSAAWPVHVEVERSLPGYRLAVHAGGADVELRSGGVNLRRSADRISLRVAVEAALPASFSLSQNYPNPFNPVTSVSFSLAEASSVRLEVYDITGRLVSTLVGGVLPAGPHAAEWTGRSDAGQELSSGVYVVRLTAVSVSGAILTDSRKALLVR